MRVRLTPNTGADPKVFDVVGLDMNTENGQLTLTCRDGRVCLGLVGGWIVSVQSSRLLPMGCEDVERIHNGHTLITVN
jgi:hypothetical protein